MADGREPRTFCPRAAFPHQQHASSFHRTAPLFKTEMSGLGIIREILIGNQQIKGTEKSSIFAAYNQF